MSDSMAVERRVAEDRTSWWIPESAVPRADWAGPGLLGMPELYCSECLGRGRLMRSDRVDGVPGFWVTLVHRPECGRLVDA